MKHPSLRLTWLPLAAVGLIALAIAGCGYHLGTFAHPQIKTIGLAPVVNETLTPYASAEMRGMLSEQFMVDGSLKVKELKEADCILYCRITNVAITESAEAGYDDDKNYQAAEWKVVVTAEFSVLVPSRKEPLIPKRTVTGSAIFQVFGDPNAQQRRGIQMACRDAAEMIVEYTTEAW
jgi:hypothetical protein